jgi:hypothetical protein
MNVSAVDTIDLSGVHFTAGVTFTFPDGLTVGPQQRVLVVRNVAAFTSQFGSALPVAGEYTGSLDNSGEEIALAGTTGAEILRFSYKDTGAWPAAADGAGLSLVVLSPLSRPDLNLAENWRLSTKSGGTPGGSDSTAFAGNPTADIDRDGINALLEYVFGSSDAVVSPGVAPVEAFQTFDVGAGLQVFLTLNFHRQPGADDAIAKVQFSTDLATWLPAVFVSRTPEGDETWRAPIPVAGPQFLRLRAQLP